MKWNETLAARPRTIQDCSCIKSQRHAAQDVDAIVPFLVFGVQLMPLLQQLSKFTLSRSESRRKI